MASKEKPHIERIVISCRDGFDLKETHPFDVPAVQQIEEIHFHENVTFLIGENGSGKSTILEAIALAAGFGEEGGTKNVRFRLPTRFRN